MLISEMPEDQVKVERAILYRFVPFLKKSLFDAKGTVYEKHLKDLLRIIVSFPPKRFVLFCFLIDVIMLLFRRNACNQALVVIKSILAIKAVKPIVINMKGFSKFLSEIQKRTSHVSLVEIKKEEDSFKIPINIEFASFEIPKSSEFANHRKSDDTISDVRFERLPNRVTQFLSTFIKPIECPECTVKFFVFDDFKAHVETSHLNFKWLKIICNSCESNINPNSTVSHMETCDAFKIGLYQCLQCIFGSNKIDMMKKHLLENHKSSKAYFCVRMGKCSVRTLDLN